MSEPTDHDENDLTDDDGLSALYRRASTEQPPDELDRIILARAREEIKPARNNSYSYPAWSQSFSIAAVFILSVTLVLLMEKEQPVYMEESLLPAASEQEQLTAGRLTDTQPMIRKEKWQGKTEQSPDAGVGQVPGDETDKTRTIAAIPKKSKARRQHDIQERKTDVDEASSDISRFSQPLSAPRILGVTAESSTEKTTDDRSCQQLSETECLNSAACTLTMKNQEKTYQCLPARDHCELMFRQSEGNRKTCESKQGCQYIPANCYCSPGNTCICSGGEPVQCRIINQ